MSEKQLQPFEKIELGDQQSSLKIFEEMVLKYQGQVSKEDSDSAPLPADYPYKTRMSRRVYEKEKKKLQIELLKVQSWVKESGQRIVSLFDAMRQARAARLSGIWNI